MQNLILHSSFVIHHSPRQGMSLGRKATSESEISMQSDSAFIIHHSSFALQNDTVSHRQKGARRYRSDGKDIHRDGDHPSAGTGIAVCSSDALDQQPLAHRQTLTFEPSRIHLSKSILSCDGNLHQTSRSNAVHRHRLSRQTRVSASQHEMNSFEFGTNKSSDRLLCLSDLRHRLPSVTFISEGALAS